MVMRDRSSQPPASGEPGAVPLPVSSPELPARLLKLPPLPAVIGRLLRLTEEEPDCLAQTAELLRSDPAFSAEILHLTNSALFGFTAQVHCVQHATSLLGLARIKMLVIHAAAHVSLGVGRNLPFVRRCWLHSLACAEIAQHIAGLSVLTAERAYMAGLMHDIGRLALLKAYPRDYATLAGHRFESIEECRQAERVLFRFDHCETGSILARTWNLPGYFGHTAEIHHDVAEPDLDLAGIVAMACRLADALDYAAVQLRDPPPFDAVLAGFPPQLRRELAGCQPMLKAHVAARLNSLAG